MKVLTRALKSFFFSIFIVYTFNLMAIGLDVFIPINLITILFVSIFDIPGLIVLIIIYFFVF